MRVILTGASMGIGAAAARAIVEAARRPLRERVLGLGPRCAVAMERISPGFVAWILGRAYARQRREIAVKESAP